MLYDRWCDTARTQRPEIALYDLRSGRRWTFGELLDEGEKDPALTRRAGYPSGNGPEFVFEVLRCWRCNAILCPLDPGQKPPEIKGLPKRLAHVKITSASTGPARLIGLTGEALAADASNIVASMGLRPEWPNLAFISLAHSYGFSNLILPLLLHGIPLILGGDPLPEILRRAGESFPALTLPAVPALWRVWAEARALPASLRLAISAGAPLPLPLEESVYHNYGLKIHNFYGASECGGIAYDAAEGIRADASYAGKALRDVTVSVGENGCLEVRSAAVAERYWPEEDAALSGGVYQTHDIAELIGCGIYLRGRASDQMNLAGRKVFPQTIESALNRHPSVAESLVFSIPTSHGERSEVMVACVAGDGAVTEQELAAFLRDQLPAWQIPRKWWLVKSLSVNHRGKLSRRQWREEYLAEKKPA